MPDFTLAVFGHLFIVSWYGLFISLGLLLATVWCYRRWPIERTRKVWLAWLCLLTGLLGSRVAFGLMKTGGLSQGLTWYGGQLACMAVLVAFSRLQRISLPALTDASVPPVIAMLAVFRIGCLVAGCCYGAPTHLPWGITYPVGHPTHPLAVHPTPVYEILFLGALLFFILRFEKKLSPGMPTAIFLIAYGAERFFMDYIRGDRLLLFPELNFSYIQAISLCIITLGVGVRAYLKTARRESPAVKRGFTLAELLLGLTILAVIATFSIPKIINASRNEQHIAVAKEAASMISGAWEKYKLQNGNATVELRTAVKPHINYVTVYTGLIDQMQYGAARAGCTSTGGSIDCSDASMGECFRLQSGAVLALVKNGNALGIESNIGTSPNSYAIFVVDTTGKYDGMASIVFGITRNGRVTPPEFIDPATWSGTNPTWFKW